MNNGAAERREEGASGPHGEAIGTGLDEINREEGRMHPKLLEKTLKPLLFPVALFHAFLREIVSSFFIATDAPKYLVVSSSLFYQFLITLTKAIDN